VAGGAREGHQVRPQAAGGAAGLLDRGQHQPADPGEAGAAPAEPGQLACTPAAAQYDLLEPADIAIVTLDGEQVDGRKPPTSELRMHRMFCRYRPEIGAIVHTHGKAVMTFANLGWTLPPILTGLCEATGGAVLTSPYSQPGTDQMYTYTAPALRDRGATFLRYHGLPAIGADLEHAFHTAAVVEGACEVYLSARQFGPVAELPAAQAEWIGSFWQAQFPGAPGPRPIPDPLPAPEIADSGPPGRMTKARPR
jgi:ribulose-5-phosphate 4-epimerase/fuculose-1-phosphate aldolase